MDLTIIIPSLNEGYHLRTLAEKIRAIFMPFSIEYEIWIIDDSTDNTTPALIEKMIADIPTVRWVHRNHVGGQNSAIIEGFRRSIGEYVIVMDSTLRHPPELLIDMYHALITDTDMIISSRFLQKAHSRHLSGLNKLKYWLTQRMNKIQLPNSNTITDCTNHYFGLKRTVIKNIEFNSNNHNVLIEILTKGDFQNIREIPYPLTHQKKYAYKINIKKQLSHLRQIKNLLSYKN